ncbi:thermonuclease family protein, partial [Patescibacteria group bacterium]
RKKWLATAIISAVFLFIINAGDYIDLSNDEMIELDEYFVDENQPEDSEELYQGKNEKEYLEDSEEDEFVTVRRVIDGDTIELDDGRRIRYIGIDAPEMNNEDGEPECFAIEATNENKKMVLGKEVILEKGVSETDKYDRLLRYVYVGPILINDYLLDKGMAKTVYIKPDVAYYEEFKEVEDEAKEEKRGLWADGICNE